MVVRELQDALTGVSRDEKQAAILEREVIPLKNERIYGSRHHTRIPERVAEQRAQTQTSSLAGASALTHSAVPPLQGDGPPTLRTSTPAFSALTAASMSPIVASLPLLDSQWLLRFLFYGRPGERSFSFPNITALPYYRVPGSAVRNCSLAAFEFNTEKPAGNLSECGEARTELYAKDAAGGSLALVDSSSLALRHVAHSSYQPSLEPQVLAFSRDAPRRRLALS